MASPTNHVGAKLLRRGYSYADGQDPLTGQLDAGLFFICFNRDPRTQFVPVQRALSQHDLLNEYIKHTSSAISRVGIFTWSSRRAIHRPDRPYSDRPW